jgi:hypothetical protein
LNDQKNNGKKGNKYCWANEAQLRETRKKGGKMDLGLTIVGFLLVLVGIGILIILALNRKKKRTDISPAVTQSRYQKQILIAGVLIFILMGIFPPWLQTIDTRGEYGRHGSKSVGYAFIMSPPTNDSWVLTTHLDISRLLVQWVLVFVATGTGMFLTSAKKMK